MKVLVTGGAGYIAGFMAERLLSEGHEVVVADSLVRGNEAAIPERAIFEKGDLADPVFLDTLFSKHAFEVVFHFAGYISVAESMKKPGMYYTNNVSMTIDLLDTMVEHNVTNFIFSSSAAVYGTPTVIPIPEDHRKDPESPYGHSKLMIEEVLRWYNKAFGLNYVALRYFNAAGAALDGSRGERHAPETHMIPSAIAAVLNNKEFTLFGNDYDTRDGTCVRDYIHVLDLVEAHMLAAKKIQEHGGGYSYNVGTGNGYSNKEVADEVSVVANKAIQIKYSDRRAGDPSQLIADATKIHDELGFTPRYSDLHTIIDSAWKWHSGQKENVS